MSFTSVQADDHKDKVNPVGTWKVTGLKIGDAPHRPLPHTDHRLLRALVL